MNQEIIAEILKKLKIKTNCFSLNLILDIVLNEMKETRNSRSISWEEIKYVLYSNMQNNKLVDFRGRFIGFFCFEYLNFNIKKVNFNINRKLFTIYTNHSENYFRELELIFRYNINFDVLVKEFLWYRREKYQINVDSLRKAELASLINSVYRGENAPGIINDWIYDYEELI